MLWIVSGIIISYLIGSIPTGYIFGKVLKGIDIRKSGSGNIGATNAWRVLGKTAGLSVLALDVIKGVLPVIFISRINPGATAIMPQELFLILLGVSCICGHNWTVFLQFKGGKGIATTLGVLIGLSFKIAGLKLILGLIILTWILAFTILRIVSAASILSAVFLPIYMLIFRQSKTLIYSSLLLSVFVIIRHKSNLIRLFQGKESRLKF